MCRKLLDDKRIWTAIYIVFGLMAIVSLLQGCRNAIGFSQDFQWDATKALVMRINPYLESLSPTKTEALLEFDAFFSQMEANQFPSLLALLIPYTFLSPLVARYTWLASNLLFTGGIIWLLRKTFMKKVDIKVFVLLALVMISGTPYRNQLGVGQHTLFSFMFFLLAVYLIERREVLGCNPKKINVPATLCLVICYFKYTLTVPLALYFVYKRKWKELSTSVAIHVVLTCAAAVWLRASVLDMIIQPLRVSSALVAEGGIDFGALLQGSSFAYVLAVLLMIALFVIALRMPAGREVLMISLLLLCSLIITYHRTYDFFVLITVAALFYEEKQNKLLLALYVAVLFTVFYVLRVFSEAAPALIFAGTLYYGFTMCIMILCIQACGRKTNNQRNGMEENG